MSIDTLNYILSKYYESLTATQYLYQNEIKNPSEYVYENEDITSPRTKYKIEIDMYQRLIDSIEELRDNLVNINL